MQQEALYSMARQIRSAQLLQSGSVMPMLNQPSAPMGLQTMPTQFALPGAMSALQQVTPLLKCTAGYYI